MNNVVNAVVDRLNTDPRSNLKGMIDRNGGNITFAHLASCISYFYPAKRLSKENERRYLVQTTKELISKWNELTEEDMSYLDKTFSFTEIAIILYVFNEHTTGNMSERIQYLLSQKDKLDKTKFASKTMRKSIANEIAKL